MFWIVFDKVYLFKNILYVYLFIPSVVSGWGAMCIAVREGATYRSWAFSLCHLASRDKTPGSVIEASTLIYGPTALSQSCNHFLKMLKWISDVMGYVEWGQQGEEG